MEYTSYQLVGENTASLNTGSYLNRAEYSLFVKGFATEPWYGLSANDVIELGVWDHNQNLISWKTIGQEKQYNPVTLSYTNTLNFPVTYSYRELISDFILYKNEQILVNPSQELSASFQILSGSYILTYNFVREMAGNISSPLVVKDISPSRKELKLVPLSASTPAYSAFCQKKVLVSDISPLYIDSVKNCPYSNIYSAIAPLYPNEINIIRNVFFLTTDAAIVQFFKNLYEDQWIYRSTSTDTKSETIRIQGIRTYFDNFLLSNLEKIVDFAEVDGRFMGFVSASIERKFAPIGAHPIQPYVEAKAFVFDFFTKYFYTPISNRLSKIYNDKYYSHLKNALNFGNNRLLPIINSGMMDERVDSTDSMTLLLKLQAELPNDIQIQTPCWVTNVSLTPYVVNAIIKSPSSSIIYKIGPPNFSIPIPNASMTNTNLSYTAEDLKIEDQTNREVDVSKNIQELSVDYTDFQNFVVFSSAELRLKIFKNKIINISALSSSLNTLNSNNSTFIATNGSIYPNYSQEYADIQGKINEYIDSFDGYESYLYRGGSYTYKSGSFVSSSYVVEMDNLAAAYDKTNRDSLINNCPEHILTDSNNDEYIIFLSMIGHFFDNIYIYIANMPSERRIGNDTSAEFTRRIVDYMLQTFGWNLDDSLEQSNILNNYLTSEEVGNLNAISAEDRLKIIRNRILINLPQIYKTKGTEEAVKLILACYGIPSSLLSVREYGGMNYADEKASYTTYERVYLRQWNTASQYDTYYLQCPPGSRTYLYKFSVDDAESYTYGIDHALVGGVSDISVGSTTIDGSGGWASGFVRTPNKNSGKIFFRIGNIAGPILKIYSPEFPLFDGNIYSVMLRRNQPDAGFEYPEDPNATPSKFDLYVQRNESGEQILRLTSSVICYDTASNYMFGEAGHILIGGWFTYWNRGGYTGCFDKFQMWRTSLSDNDFENYVDNINSYAFGGSNSHENLIFRMHYDYPIDQRQFVTGSSDILEVSDTNWAGVWQNGNPYFATGSEARLEELYGIYGVNVDYMVSRGAWQGAQTLTPDTCSATGFISSSCYPWQFKVIDYPNTWNISKYGPNKFRNEKIRHISQSIEARFDNLNRSTYVPASSTSPDSNQVGFFVDPQDFKNRDIVRYLGNFDLMDSIGDPSNQFSQSYSSLKTLRKEYADAHLPSGGSKTLYNELLILYKLYFNRSVFESIRNVLPSRANTIVGVLIEPTILERPKYQAKEVSSEINSGSAVYLECAAVHYYKDPLPENRLVTIAGSSAEMERSTSIEVSYIALPVRDYPVNFGGNYIADFADPYNKGHFTGGILSQEELQSLILLPEINFIGVPTYGVAMLPVQFTAQCFNTTAYKWIFGDEALSRINPASFTEIASPTPLHTYEWAGLYTVTLTGYNGGFSNSKTRVDYIKIDAPIIHADFEATPTAGIANSSIFTFTNNSTLANAPLSNLSYLWQFGDGTTSTEINPTHIYANQGTYTVTLTATWGHYSDTEVKSNYIFADTPITPCGGTINATGGQSWPTPYSTTINLGTSTGVVTLRYDMYSVPDRMAVVWNGNTVIDTGYCGDSRYQSQIDSIVGPGNTIRTPSRGTATFNKTESEPQSVTIYVWGPLGGTSWKFSIGCPNSPPDPFPETEDDPPPGGIPL
jgi:PKD repeat protein